MKGIYNPQLSPRQKELLACLDEAYRRNVIDGAPVIYRDFGDCDVEVCGGRTARAPFHVFVWQKKPHLEIIERYMDIPHDCGRVAVLLDRIARKYDRAAFGRCPEETDAPVSVTIEQDDVDIIGRTNTETIDQDCD